MPLTISTGSGELARDHDVVYVPCHRSHIDYLLLSYVLYKNGLMPPHIAAGINLNMPWSARSCAAAAPSSCAAASRTTRSTALCSTNTCTVFFGGYSVEYFIEGGRSRTRPPAHPAPGMLAMTVRSFLRGQQEAS